MATNNPIKHLCAAALSLAVMAGLAGCTGAHSLPAERVERLAAVEVASVSQGEVSSHFTGSATLQARESATVVARSAGLLTEIHVEEGDQVAAGQLLARIDEQRLLLEIRRIEAGVTRMQAELSRSEAMLARGMVSAELHERLRFQVDAERAALQLARLEHEYTAVRAPFAGTVTRRHVRKGQLLTNHAPIFDIADFAHLQARFDVPENVALRMLPGTQVSLQADAVPDLAAGGRIARISPEVDRNSGTVAVTVDVDAANAGLRPGMFVRTWVAMDTIADASIIPRRALMTERGRTTVFVVKDGLAQRRDVQVGLEQGHQIQIIAGLDADAQVVVTGQSALRDGEAVDVVLSAS